MTPTLDAGKLGRGISTASWFAQLRMGSVRRASFIMIKVAKDYNVPVVANILPFIPKRALVNRIG